MNDLESEMYDYLLKLSDDSLVEYFNILEQAREEIEHNFRQNSTLSIEKKEGN